MRKRKTANRSGKPGRFVIGREGFDKISAVEGLRMPRSMRNVFLALDKNGASARIRRSMLSEKYGK
jgi:hypothetical protein